MQYNTHTTQTKEEFAESVYSEENPKVKMVVENYLENKKNNFANTQENANYLFYIAKLCKTITATTENFEQSIEAIFIQAIKDNPKLDRNSESFLKDLFHSHIKFNRDNNCRLVSFCTSGSINQNPQSTNNVPVTHFHTKSTTETTISTSTTNTKQESSSFTTNRGLDENTTETTMSTPVTKRSIISTTDKGWNDDSWKEIGHHLHNKTMNNSRPSPVSISTTRSYLSGSTTGETVRPLEPMISTAIPPTIGITTLTHFAPIIGGVIVVIAIIGTLIYCYCKNNQNVNNTPQSTNQDRNAETVQKDEFTPLIQVTTQVTEASANAIKFSNIANQQN